MDGINRYWLGACGIPCFECKIRLRADDVLAYFKGRNVDPEKIRCAGCRSIRDDGHWSADCKVLDCCVYQKGLPYCSECPEFACETLTDWGRQGPSHAEAVERLREMRAQGTEAWLISHGYE